MSVNVYGILTLILGIIGFSLTIFIERLLIPQPSLKRLSSAWSVHLGIYFLVFSIVNLCLGRVVSSFLLTQALFITLVLINNTKVRNLNESLTAQDYEFVTDIICHPRLFLPYFGIVKFIFSTIIFLVALIGIYLEPTPSAPFDMFLSAQNWSLFSYNTIIILFFFLSLNAFFYHHTNPLTLSFIPFEDTHTHGLLASLYMQAFALKKKPDVSKSFYNVIERKEDSPLPNLVAVQSESFFDPRPFFPIIKPEILSTYDKTITESKQSGFLNVPAWGGNTVRTEFAFLTALSQKTLEMHRFNPYVLTASAYPIPSLPLYLKSLGYKIVFIHPFIRNFYKREEVFKLWQVDKYISRESFAKNKKFGPYISDIEVARCMRNELKIAEEDNQPIFVFAITMENHGPLHLEKVRPKDLKVYNDNPPTNFDDLTIYLRHLKHADTMISMLTKHMDKSNTPTSFCFYGDHVPIMPKVYDALTKPVRDSNYFIWNNQALQKLENHIEIIDDSNKSKDLIACDLSIEWLKSARIV